MSDDTDIVAELDRWLDDSAPIPERILQAARDEIVALRNGDAAWRQSFEVALRDARFARAEQRERDEEIALRYTGESYVAELIANAIRNQGDEM